MFDFGNANDGQRQAISTTEGPVLITAGPGTGKTYTLVQRAIYLIEERGVKPEDIFIATFTEKAAKELITRITNELASRNITVNVNEMYVGTFHSLCLRIIKDHFYNKWMITTSGSKFKFEWDKFRYDKRIVANETSKIESPCVVKLASKDDEDEWHERVLDFINRLKNSGKIQDYNQLAFLFSSVKHERVISLARFLESNHINVYSPRSDMFFRREGITFRRSK